MEKLTKMGQDVITDIASEYKLKKESVETMLIALKRGNGTMAQFSIPELGGAGQWMRGGMTMVSDMFNNSLKAKVDQLCLELSDRIRSLELFEDDSAGEISTESSAHKTSREWPAVFGTPSASGSQNNFRYAYFPHVKRLVIDDAGKRYIYDTKHHVISGVSQQQGAGQSYVFSSQLGSVNLAELSLISEPDKQPTPQEVYDMPTSVPVKPVAAGVEEDAIFEKIKRLGEMFEKGYITEEEFKDKKKELLSRL
ncbi:hypothetical protein DYBT9275_00424 [Dyadobacter sp. CECT 9275]|uniref:SHOCT domain-containing protein n=1 Tax=Dyadobacter helix TaxID=2822344 RepID=A0A916N461_9BACT|nr:SHOCT domain-containing protein [Dyadobacter sp. CECT 9275]CAG4989998.1 hypothetical protein DYBT9275_00424 [Dyadobacter sp. CECT 9275]